MKPTNDEVNEIISDFKRDSKSIKEVAQIFSGSKIEKRQRAYIDGMARASRYEKLTDCLAELLELRVEELKVKNRQMNMFNDCDKKEIHRLRKALEEINVIIHQLGIGDTPRCVKIDKVIDEALTPDKRICTCKHPVGSKGMSEDCRSCEKPIVDK